MTNLILTYLTRLPDKPHNIGRVERHKILLSPCHDTNGCTYEARWRVGRVDFQEGQNQLLGPDAVKVFRSVAGHANPFKIRGVAFSCALLRPFDRRKVRTVDKLDPKFVPIQDAFRCWPTLKEVRRFGKCDHPWRWLLAIDRRDCEQGDSVSELAVVLPAEPTGEVCGDGVPGEAKP